MTDVVVVGGGVIGLSVAWELAVAGLQVSVLDQSGIGQEASWAGAGMIPPGDLYHSATHQLAVLSMQRWPEISAALKSETGLDNGYTRCGGMLLDDGRSPAQQAEAWKKLHLTVELLDSRQLHDRVPAFGPEIISAAWLPDMAQVRNPHHLQALHAACLTRGVQFFPHEKVVGWERQGDRLLAAVTEKNRYAGDQFLVATGAWGSQLLSSLNVEIPIEPVHGQIALLRAEKPLFSFVIEAGKHYLVPRRDGRILIGATEERIGFQKRNTDEAIAALRRFAATVMPALEHLPLEKSWSGLRPWSGLDHPSLGRVPEFSNLLLSLGHFRAGLSNSPGTALILRQLFLDEPPTIDIAGLSW